MPTVKQRAVARAPRPFSLERKQLASAIAAALAIPALGLQTAHAQEPSAQTQQPEEVLVTGSRIVRRDYDANSPLQTVDRGAFESQNSIGLETVLNELPQFVPAAQGATQLQDQSQMTDNFTTLTAGASTISLRGLGANRNLVLLDGYRAVPVNATMAVDVNSIPAAAIERVEVITGGASSVYGADAVAGVVNFILKRDFEGLDLDVQTGALENGAGGESRASALFGVSSGDGSGNIMLGLELAKRGRIHADDTDFWHDALRDGTTYPTQLIYTGPYYTVDTANAPLRSVMNGIFNQAQGTIMPNAANPTRVGGGSFYWNADGSLYTGGASFSNNASTGGRFGVYRYNGPTSTSRENANQGGDYPFRYVNNEGLLVQHILPFEANIPLNRSSIFGRATYDLSDTVSAYAQVLSVTSKTRRFYTDSPAVAGWGMIAPHSDTDIYAPSLNANGTTNAAYLPGGQYGLNCAPTGGCTKSQAFPVSPELDALLDSRGNPNADWSFNYGMDFGDFGAPGNLYRSIFSETRTNQIAFGLKGEVEGIDGTWDLIVSKGLAKLDLRLEGYASLARVRTIMLSPNWGYGFFAQGNAAPPGNGFSGGIATCSSGVPVFSRNHGDISQDCLDAMFVTLNHQSEMEQKFVEGNFQGHAFDLPAGEARFSAGIHSRSNSYYYFFDQLQTGNSFNDNPEGFPADNTRGETGVDEVYGELLLPLLDGKTGARHLNLELGYRYSDYDLQGGISTYKALLDWGITDTLRFRGGRQLATRAPNIAELFQAKTQSWSVQVQGEPCALNSQVAYGANPTKNPNAAAVRALCSSIIGAAAGEYYTAQQAIINPIVWLPFVDATGNPQVNPEEAKTLTAGFVWSPNTQYEKLNGLNLTIDYYDIKVTDMISVEGAYTVYEKCLSAASNPTYSPQHPECLKINRNPVTGGATTTTVSYINAAFAEVSGVDVTADWRTELAGGMFGVNFMVSRLLEETTQETTAAAKIDWKGSLGPTANTSLNNGAYDYRTFTTFNYGRGDWNVALRWRHLPSAIDASQAAINSNIEAGLLPANAPPSPLLGAEKSYDVFDLSGGYEVSERTSLRFGVDNLFDEAPVCTGGRTAADPHPSPCGGETEAGYYDIYGRSLYMGVKVTF
jgi:iron complex outermembrane receptor protein